MVAAGIALIASIQVHWICPDDILFQFVAPWALLIGLALLAWDWFRFRNVILFNATALRRLFGARRSSLELVAICLIGILVVSCLYTLIEHHIQANKLSRFKSSAASGLATITQTTPFSRGTLSGIKFRMQGGTEQSFVADTAEVQKFNLAVGAVIPVLYPPGEPQKAIPRDFVPNSGGIGLLWFLILMLIQFPTWYWIKSSANKQADRNI